MTYNLFLDDMRDPTDVTWIDYEGRDTRRFVVVRNFWEFKRHVVECGIPAFVSFDHDLADWHYGGDYTREYTGKECAEFLVGLCYSEDVPFPPYKIHSMNPVGVERIRNAINSI